jgi:antibiotic biosynthesis monooxygenase (ABM) superfamily enzyme
MSTNSRVMLVTQNRVKPEKNALFEQWQQKITQAIATLPGYISSNIQKPNPPLTLDWVAICYFTTLEAAKAWIQSPVRQALITESAPYLLGINNLYLVEENKHDQVSVTASITTKVPAEVEQKFIEWQASVAPIESKFPGFIGCKLERPRQGSNDDWITLLTFDNDKNLETWLASPERKKMLEQLKTFTPESRVEKLYVGFDFWFKRGGDENSQAWKENMLVLLTLYPIVFLFSFIQNPIMKAGVPFWLALFFGNAISTVLLGSVTVPWLIGRFKWWLDSKQPRTLGRDSLGACVVIMLYILSLVGGWLLSPFL